MSSDRDRSPVVCRGCGRRDGTHETDCRVIALAAKEKLQSECDHRPEYGVTRTTGIPLGPPCCGRCGLELHLESALDACRGRGDAPPHELRVCQCYAPTCTRYLCAVCGVAVPWHENLMIANPTISGRFCDECVNVEAAYHGLSVEEMHACRARLRVRRIAQCDRSHPLPRDTRDRFEMEIARDRGGRPGSVFSSECVPLAGTIPGRVSLVGSGGLRDTNAQPSRPYLERGEACWCHRAKDCDGNHEFRNVSMSSR